MKSKKIIYDLDNRGDIKKYIVLKTISCNTFSESSSNSDYVVFAESNNLDKIYVSQKIATSSGDMLIRVDDDIKNYLISYLSKSENEV